MDASSQPGTKSSTNGPSNTVTVDPNQGSAIPPIADGGRTTTHDKRQSIQNNNPPPHPPQLQKRNEQAGAKRSGFGLFGKFKDEDDDREQLKRLKAENKQLRTQFR